MIPKGPQRSKLRILVVEDQEDDLEILEFQLSDLQIPYALISFPDGEEAIRYLNNKDEEGLPQLIILDLFLPGNSGIQILEELKKDPKFSSIPAVILSNSRDGQSVREVYRKGGVSFLPKPCTTDMLRDVISHLQISGLIKLS